MRRPLVALAAAAVGAALAYAPSLQGEFQFDDWTSIQVNWAIRNPGRVLHEIGPLDLLGPGRPVTDLAFALDQAVGGMLPLAFHVTSLALHLAAMTLAFLLVRDVLRRVGHARAVGVAAFVAGAFALHPLQTESVCYAAQLAEVLASTLYLAALLLLVRARDAWPRPTSWGWAVAGTAALALALGAKTMAVTLPAAFLLHAAIVGGDPGSPPITRRALRALALSAGAWALSLGAVVKNLVQLGPDSGAGLSAGDLGPWRYFLTQLRVHWLYARLLVWPAGQSVDRAFPSSPGLEHGPTLAAAGASVALLALGGWLWWRAERGANGAARAAAFGIAWWLLLLTPTSSVVPLADVVAEHRLYLALLGALLALALGADAVLGRLAQARTRRAALALGAVAWVALGGALTARAWLWRSQLALWADAAAKSPDSSRAVGNYAYALHASGAGNAAAPVYVRALLLARTPREVAGTARNLASLYLELKRFDEALGAADLGLGAVPHDFELRGTRALALRSLRRTEEAIVEASRAVALAEREPLPHDTLGLVLLSRPDPARALAEFRIARQVDSRTRLYADHEIAALAMLRRIAEACAAWEALLAMGGPEDPNTERRAAEMGCRTR